MEECWDFKNLLKMLFIDKLFDLQTAPSITVGFLPLLKQKDYYLIFS